MAKISQPAKRPDGYTGKAWTYRKTADGYQVLELDIRQGEVLTVTPEGEPNLKQLVPPVIEGLVADHLVGGDVA